VRAAILAPLIAPLIFAVLLESANYSSRVGLKNALGGTLLLFVLSSIVCYGASFVIGLPLMLLAWWRMRVTALVALGVGALAGLIVDVPLTWFDYQSSGVDSGPPPPIAVLQFLKLAFVGSSVVIYIIAGVVTSGAFYFLFRMGAEAHQPHQL